VEDLADRIEGFIPASVKHFESLVPLQEIIAASIGATTASKKVKEKYSDLIHNLGPELFILREAQISDIEFKAGPLIAEGIRRIRTGKVKVQPGYDGEYGKIKILEKDEIDRLSLQSGYNKKEKACHQE
jgi:PHP family Zn ribbon phosphoesterase